MTTTRCASPMTPSMACLAISPVIANAPGRWPAAFAAAMCTSPVPGRTSTRRSAATAGRATAANGVRSASRNTWRPNPSWATKANSSPAGNAFIWAPSCEALAREGARPRLHLVYALLCRVPAEPGLGLTGLSRDRAPAHALGLAAANVVGDGRVSEAVGHLGGPLCGSVAFRRVEDGCQAVPVQCSGDKARAQADLGRDRADGLVLDQVTFMQVRGDVTVAEPWQRGDQGGIGAVACQLPRRGGGRRINPGQVTGQPVFVQPRLPADRGQAETSPRPVGDEGADVRIAVGPGCRSGCVGEMPVRPFPVGRGDDGGRRRRPRLRCFSASLFWKGAAPGSSSSVLGEFSGPSTRTARLAARPDRGVEEQPYAERGGTELAGLLALEWLTALQAEHLAVARLGPAVRCQMRGDGAE